MPEKTRVEMKSIGGGLSGIYVNSSLNKNHRAKLNLHLFGSSGGGNYLSRGRILITSASEERAWNETRVNIEKEIHKALEPMIKDFDKAVESVMRTHGFILEK